jgi:hypothetical protein
MLGSMGLPIPPTPEERPKIRKAIRVARFMKWYATPISGLTLVFSIFAGMIVAWYVGVVILILSWGVLFIIVGHCLSRCPRCGQVWWDGMGGTGFMGWYGPTELAAQKDEAETLVCRRCRLDIGLGLED